MSVLGRGKPNRKQTSGSVALVENRLTLTATVISGTEIDLSWNSVTGASAYDLERNGTVIATGIVGTAYNDTGLAPSTTYTYNVRTEY